jgi:hypothetical protein
LADAVLPPRAVVLGLPLMPYSIGCELQLHREESPFLLLSRAAFDALPAEAQCLALIRAVTICCKSPTDRPIRWRWCLAGCPVRLWPFKTVIQLGNGADFPLAVAEFRNYIEAGRLEFRAELPSGDDAPLRYIGAPEILRLYQFICRHIPRQEIAIWGKSAWDFPLGFARMLAQAHAEEQGGLEIFNHKTKVVEDYMTQCEAGRIAWQCATTDDAKRLALAEHPIIAELAVIAEEYQAWQTAQTQKGTPCPA